MDFIIKLLRSVDSVSKDKYDFVTNTSMYGCERCERAGPCLVGLSVPWRYGIIKPYTYLLSSSIYSLDLISLLL